ncbi:DMT family protein, partial [Bacteroides sp.]|uniref:DMT family protein n=1 Tax=Bacteroides sp. TaxID=29523 RepID=UPI003AB2845C
YSVILLIFSNVFMTFAWYGHLKMRQEFSWFAALPLIGVIVFSWSIAFFEYNKTEKPNWEFNTLR